MSTTPERTLDPFQTALLVELREVVADGPPRRVRPRRTPVLVAAAVALAVAGTAVVLPAVLGDRTAYAVVEGSNGVVDVRVDRLEDAPGLERALEAAGVRADVTYLPVDTVCAEGRYVDAASHDPSADVRFEVGAGFGYRIRLGPGAVADDQTLVISASRTSDSVQADGSRLTNGSIVSVGTAQGPVAPCVTVPGPS